MKSAMSPMDALNAYFSALTNGDLLGLLRLMAPVDYYVKIGTDAGEHIEGADAITDYFRNVLESAQDLRIETEHLDTQVRGDVAWFYVRQTWRLKWNGVPETLPMRITGVLERFGGEWRFAQIHASVGTEVS